MRLCSPRARLPVTGPWQVPVGTSRQHTRDGRADLRASPRGACRGSARGGRRRHRGCLPHVCAMGIPEGCFSMRSPPGMCHQRSLPIHWTSPAPRNPDPWGIAPVTSPRAWGGWDGSSLAVAAAHPERASTTSLHLWPSWGSLLATLPLPLVSRGRGVSPAAASCLPALARRQRSITAHSEPALCLPVDIQAPALAVGPTACDFHREYFYCFARYQHSSLNSPSAVKILANLQRAFFFPKLFITP